MNNKQISELFLKAASINSPSGSEKKMAKWVFNQMNDLGWKAWEDSAGKKNKSNSGNVYAALEINQKLPYLVFCAHLDTVQKKEDVVKPFFDGKIFKSDGKTILGADNKASIASLISGAKTINKNNLKNNLLFFFPTREEAGIMGSSFFKFNKKVKFVFNLDNSDKPGIFVYKALGYINFKISIQGKAAHAAKEYEKGKNAIVAAADLVKKLPMGKNEKEGWTLNLGTISGGAKTNIVCDMVRLKGELRAFSKESMGKVISLIKTYCGVVEKKYGVKVSIVFDWGGYIPPFISLKGGEIAKACASACKKIGIDSFFETSYSTSDANSFSGMGYKVISVSRGGKNVHTCKEELKLADLLKTISLTKELMYIK